MLSGSTYIKGVTSVSVTRAIKETALYVKTLMNAQTTKEKPKVNHADMFKILVLTEVSSLFCLVLFSTWVGKNTREIFYSI